MKNILIFLEKMGIGGVETSVINQAIEYKRRGINCVIVSDEGILSNTLKENNITQEIIEFPLENNINLDKAKEIINIIEKYDIELVLINQIPCILSVLPACIIKNIPYIAYVHNAKKTIKNDEKNMFDWYERQFPVYKKLLRFYYNHAYKVVSISKMAEEYVKNRYNVDEDKMMVLHNSINLEKYKSTKDIDQRNSFILISRLSMDKLQSIKNGIDIFDLYESENKRLQIVGDGDKFDEIKEYVNQKESKDKISFLGKRENIIDLINEHDIVLGVDRVLLEAVSLKRIAVNTGYDKPKQIIDLSNISIEAEEGFCGEDLKETSAEELANQIQNSKIDLQANYDFVKKNLNIENNIYLEEPKNANNKDALFNLFEIIKEQENTVNFYENNIKSLQDDLILKNNEIGSLKIKIEELQKEYDYVKSELEKVYNSKRFKLINKIANLFWQSDIFILLYCKISKNCFKKVVNNVYKKRKDNKNAKK